jgi:hypothetical protein
MPTADASLLCVEVMFGYSYTTVQVSEPLKSEMYK